MTWKPPPVARLLLSVTFGFFLSVLSLPNAAARGAPEPAALLRTLGGLRAPLEAEGWTLTPARGSLTTVGDILDPVDQQVIITGADCFGPLSPRSGDALSFQLNKALQLGGEAVGLGKASVSGNLSVSLQDPVISELPVSTLRPLPRCTELLQLLSREGQDAARFTIVASALTADLSLNSCAAAAAGVAGNGASAETSLSSCKSAAGNRLIIAVKTTPVSTALALVGASLEAVPAPLGVSAKKTKGQPCWMTAPCPPFAADTHRSATGSGPSLGAADEAARAALLAPFLMRARAVSASVGGGPEAEAAEGAARDRLLSWVTIADRVQAGPISTSLAALPRGSTTIALRQEIEAAESGLPSLEPGAPLDTARRLARALPTVRRLAYRYALQSAVEGQTIRPTLSWPDLQERLAIARSAVLIAVPDEERALRSALSLQGLSLAVRPAEAILVLRVSTQSSQSRVSGFQQIRIEREATIAVNGGPSRTVVGSGQGASSDTEKASRGARAEADQILSEAVTAAILEIMG